MSKSVPTLALVNIRLSSWNAYQGSDLSTTRRMRMVILTLGIGVYAHNLGGLAMLVLEKADSIAEASSDAQTIARRAVVL